MFLLRAIRVKLLKQTTLYPLSELIQSPHLRLESQYRFECWMMSKPKYQKSANYDWLYFQQCPQIDIPVDESHAQIPDLPSSSYLQPPLSSPVLLFLLHQLQI